MKNKRMAVKIIKSIFYGLVGIGIVYAPFFFDYDSKHVYTGQDFLIFGIAAIVILCAILSYWSRIAEYISNVLSMGGSIVILVLASAVFLLALLFSTDNPNRDSYQDLVSLVEWLGILSIPFFSLVVNIILLVKHIATDIKSKKAKSVTSKTKK